MTRFLLLPIGIGALLLTGAPTAEGGSLPKRLVGYYGSWTKTQNPPYSADQIPYSKLTHIIHAGTNISDAADGTFQLPQGFLEPELINRAHRAGVKVLFYLGANSGSVFSAVAANPAYRATLVQGLQGVIPVYGYDGIDIDWEYPGGGTDRGNFSRMMAEIRQAFPAPAYVTSIDVPNIPSNGYGFPELMKTVDMFNIMMYDCAGPWAGIAQFNSPIFRDPANPNPQGTAARAAWAFANRYGVPADQLNMGTPFYGYVYLNAAGLWQPCNPCNNATVVYEPYGTFIKQRVDHLGWVRNYDSLSLVPYLLRGDGSPGFITYDDPASTYRRVWYSLWKGGLGGSFMWSLDADYDGQGQDLLEAMYQATISGGN